MKSIKEQANEYAKDYLFSHLFSPLPQRAPNVHFAAGANYVLGEIEPIIKANLGSYKFQLDKIKQIIEQLKSNQ